MKNIMKYDEYKNSNIDWIGEIPEHWRLIKFKYLYKSAMGQTILTPELVENGKYPVFSATEEDHYFGRIDNANVILKEGDLVIPARGNSIGSVKLVKEEATTTQTTIYSKKLSMFNLSSKFAYYFCRGNNKKHLFFFVQTAIPQITVSDVKNNYFCFPPLPEQRQIADFLEKKTALIDEFISKKKRFIELLNKQKKGIITKAVTRGIDPKAKMKDSGIEWIGEIPEHWEMKKIKYLGIFQNGIGISSDSFGSGYPFVSYSDVYKNLELPKTIDGLVESSEEDRKKYSVKEGDIFFTRTSETADDIGVASTCLETINDATFAGFVIRFRPKKNCFTNKFSKYYFRNETIKVFFTKEMNLVTRASLSQELLKRLPAFIPSLEEQSQIVEYIETKLSKIDNAMAKTEKEIKLMEKYRKTLISEVVTGKIKVAQ